MQGALSLGLLQRSAQNLVFVCGACGTRSKLESMQVPAAISIEVAANVHPCPNCKRQSDYSRIIEDGASSV
jgi:ribosomal protein L37AE/L43A